MGVGRDLLVGEGVELIADRLQGLIQATGLQRGPAARLVQQFDDAGLDRLAGSGAQPICDRREATHIDAQLRRPEHLALVHRQPAGQLAEILVRQQLRRQRLGLAQPPLARQGARPIRRLAQGLGIGRHPGQAVGGVLFSVQRAAVQSAVRGDAQTHRLGQLAAQRLALGGGQIEEVQEVRQDQAHGFLY